MDWATRVIELPEKVSVDTLESVVQYLKEQKKHEVLCTFGVYYFWGGDVFTHKLHKKHDIV